ncbi:MAG: transcriptional repressor [Rhodospirillaceae bacterium]|jgi:Fur family iron response transcriptional regulator|nr:transcriptional repressor [Rhodospirillaceae bacterium]
METKRPFTSILAKLKDAGLRPTRQRLSLAKLLFEGGDRHISAEDLHAEAVANRISVSLATIYNTLHQFTSAGLLREVVVEPGRSYFDNNITSHHHFFVEGEGKLIDIPASEVALSQLPAAPAGMKVSRVDVIVRLANDN